MEKLALRVFGTLELRADNRPVSPALRSDKIRALLVYLALEAGRPHRRRKLAGLFWPDFTEQASLRNLRKALHHLRHALDQLASQASEMLLRIDRQSVQLNGEYLAVDANQFEELLSAVEAHSHRHLHLCQNCLQKLMEASSLYQGELLAGFSLHDAAAFEEWLLLRREHLQQHALSTFELLTTAYLERGDLEQAFRHATQLVALDPFHEKAQRQLMHLFTLKGQPAKALAQFERFRGLLHDELGVEPEAETAALYRHIGAAQRGEVPPETTHKPDALHHFPVDFTPFVGREVELQRIEERLLDPECRLLTLVGAGGMGKTRLAIRAVQALSRKGRFGDGIYFFSLAAVDSRDSLLSTLAHGLGLTFSEKSTTQERVVEFLRERQSLLVLDNFEQLVDSASLLAELLTAAPGVRLLVTSHIPLGLRAEQRLRVSGLSYPAKNEAARDLATYSAVRLFADSAHRADATFSISNNEGAILEICRLVQGIPLALELAASWVNVMDCAAIAGEIRRNVDFLSRSPQDRPGRHRSMAAVFAYSWRLLRPAEQAVLGQLAVFRGPFSLEAALTISEATPLTLAQLLDKALLQRHKDGRYELHPMLRQFIRQHTGEQDEQVARRHSDYYLNVVAAQQAAFYGPQPRRALVAVQHDLDNIRQAWQWAIEQGNWPAVDGAREGLGRFYHIAARAQEGEATFALAINWLESQGGARADVAARSSLLVWRAYFLNKLGRHAEAIEVAQQALEQAAQNSGARAEVHSLFGELLPAVGRFDEAILHLEQAITQHRATDDLEQLVRALRRMALACYRGGHHDATLRYSEEAIPLLQALEHKQGLAQLYLYMAGIYYERNDLAQALAYVEQAQELHEAIEDKPGAGIVAANLASLHSRMGQFEQALASNQRAITISRELADRPGLARDFSNRGHILAIVGEFENSLDYYYRALEIEKTLGDESRVAYFHAGIATVYQMKGDEETALVYYDLALPVLLAQATSYYHVVGPLLGKAEILFQRRDRAGAAALNEQALALAMERGFPEYARQSRVLAAKLLMAEGDSVTARQQLEALLDETTDVAEQALFQYELWQMTDEIAWAEAALVAYQRACDRVPSFINKKRLDELQKVLVPSRQELR